MTPEEFKQAFIARREQLGWSQIKLGQRAGVSDKTISAYENGPTSMQLYNLIKCFAAMGRVLTLDLPPYQDNESEVE